VFRVLTNQVGQREIDTPDNPRRVENSLTSAR
jgi:hypothetical protein